MIIKGLVTFLLSAISRVTSLIVAVFTLPIAAILTFFRESLTNLSSYEDTLYYFTNTHLLPGISFAREVFFNCTGYPRPLFNLLITFLLLRFTYHMVLLPARFIIKIYYVLRGSHIQS